MSDNIIDEPNVSLSIISADVPVENAAQKILVVGQMITAGVGQGTAVPATAALPNLYPNIKNDGSENAMFGAGSQLAMLIRKIKQVAPQVRVDAMPIADNGVVKTSLNIVLLGIPTESGSLTVCAGGFNEFRYNIPITANMPIADIASAIKDKITADVNSPFDATSSAGTVALIAKNAGTWGRQLPVWVQQTGTIQSDRIAGIAQIQVALQVNGAGDPVLTTAFFSQLSTVRYQGIVCNSDCYDDLAVWADLRFNTDNSVLDGVVFSGFQGTAAEVTAEAEGKNNKSLVIFCDELLTVGQTSGQRPDPFVGPTNQNPPLIQAAWFAAVRALRLTTDASIGRYLTTSSPNDQFGGPSMATLPYHNTNAPQLATTYSDIGFGFTPIEMENIKTAGGSVIGTNRTGTNAICGEVQTTFKTDPAGNPDPSFKYLNYVDTTSNSREYFFNNYKKRYAQSRLTEGAIQYGRDMVNQLSFEAYTDSLYATQTLTDLLLLQGGQAAVDFFKANRIVTLDMLNGKISVNMKIPIITQVRNIIGTVKIAFSTEG
tara:strand:+ start:1304 stop:2935 length:1632 start_codon:yes stop_codon:yes gene_type:complete